MLVYWNVVPRITSFFLSFCSFSKVRGCAQRNAALKWLKKTTNEGVIYFADDDNSYDVRLFDEIRNTEKVSVLPVGNFAKTFVSSPIVKHGKVVGFMDHWDGGRKFKVDMAVFAVSIPFWLKRGSPMFSDNKLGYLETKFLEGMNVTFADLEPKAQNATTLLVWHTKTKTPDKFVEKHVQLNKHNDTNLPQLLKGVV